ncbi:MAG: TetR/AcrR family transcriptional regulator [Proteobacteria bacterium]|nr:TetR/AcrR family transcriptional regulator [Pseudomonadota bacterium]MBU1711733.1 TetR/AcrR family transcriptional regulator [Pseudomonadota bacterium]
MGIQERKEREGERRRQQIIVAARRVFSSKGLNKATMEDIAGEAELSPGTIYLYFKNKDELYASLSLRILQYLLIRLKHVNSEKNETSEKRYAALTKAMVDFYEFDPMILISLFNLQTSETLKTLSPELLSEIQMLSSKSIEEIAIIFKQENNGEVSTEYNPSFLAETFWSLFSGVVLFQESKKSFLGEEKTYLKISLEMAFQIFKLGIKDAQFNTTVKERRITGIN